MSVEIARTGAEVELAARVVELVRRAAGPAAEAEVLVRHDAEALTRFANSAIHQNVAEATTTLRLRVHLDGRTAAGSTTVTSADGLAGLVERTIAAARLSPPDMVWPGLTPPTPLHGTAHHHGSGARSGLDFGFDEATARATPAERAALVRDFVDAAGGLETAGYCRVVYTSAGFVNTAGQAVEGRTVEAAMDGIARSDGADGVARQASGRLADLSGAALGARAAAKARAGARPVELPPGRYEVVLEPDAVADLLANLSWFGFNGRAHAQGQSFAELDAEQFDSTVTLVDEPLGSREEPAPGLPFDVEGTPRGATVLVREGVTRSVTHDRASAAEAGARSTGHASESSRTWGPIAGNVRLEACPATTEPAAQSTGAMTAASGTVTAAPGTVTPAPGAVTGAPGAVTGAPGAVAESARPLVARMRRGLLITDLWYTRVLDQKALVVTGLTRNGVWLVEDGEVVSAVSNMRFTQSYPRALGPGRVLDIGSRSTLLPDRWAGTRYAAPAVRLASWNLTGNASG